MSKLLCWVFGHQWRVEQVEGYLDSSSFEKMMKWINDDYDHYRVCLRCKAREGVGESYGV